jgi:FMN phosphatase YigB (HAD superfamily)
LAAITFDVWHTLIQLSPEAEDRYIRLQESTLAGVLRSSPRSSGHGLDKVLSPEDAAHRVFAAAMGRKGQGSPIAALAGNAARLAGREADTAAWVRAIEALVDEQPFEEVSGAREQLRRVKVDGYRTGIVSNLVGESGVSIRKVLGRLDMARFIDSWAFSEELPWAKPAPEIFWHALGPLDTPPTEAVHIGDLGSDVHGARAAGFRASVLFRGSRAYGPLYASLCRTDDPIDPPPDRLLSSWEDLPAVLESLFAEPSRR